MCVIVDTNCCHKILRDPCDTEYVAVFDWIHKRDGKLVYGGTLAAELNKDEKAKRLIRQWSLAGKAIAYSDADLIKEQERLQRTGLMKSDDPHNLALAIISKTRTTCTEDTDLWDDFRNCNLMGMNHCRIYRNIAHRNLLKHTKGCLGYKLKNGSRRRK